MKFHVKFQTNSLMSPLRQQVNWDAIGERHVEDHHRQLQATISGHHRSGIKNKFKNKFKHLHAPSSSFAEEGSGAGKGAGISGNATEDTSAADQLFARLLRDEPMSDGPQKHAHEPMSMSLVEMNAEVNAELRAKLDAELKAEAEAEAHLAQLLHEDTQLDEALRFRTPGIPFDISVG
jgi:hypothetical protein